MFRLLRESGEIRREIGEMSQAGCEKRQRIDHLLAFIKLLRSNDSFNLLKTVELYSIIL
jgi:hypothetical protein